jgi:hypothetical protein
MLLLILKSIQKIFSIEEQNNWFSASDKQALAPFLSTVLVKKIQWN